MNSDIVGGYMNENFLLLLLFSLYEVSLLQKCFWCKIFKSVCCEGERATMFSCILLYFCLEGIIGFCFLLLNARWTHECSHFLSIFIGLCWPLFLSAHITLNVSITLLGMIIQVTLHYSTSSGNFDIGVIMCWWFSGFRFSFFLFCFFSVLQFRMSQLTLPIELYWYFFVEGKSVLTLVRKWSKFSHFSKKTLNQYSKGQNELSMWENGASFFPCDDDIARYFAYHALNAWWCSTVKTWTLVWY